MRRRRTACRCPGWLGGVVIGSLTALGLTAPLAVAAHGDLDTSFNGSGMQTLNFGGTDRASHVALPTVGSS